MLTSPNRPGGFLVEVPDLKSPGALPEPANAYEEPLRTIFRWAEDYLCQPHPELGREGPVCPYVRSAMRKGLFFLTVCPGTDLTPERVEAQITNLRAWFLELEPRRGNDAIFKTILCLFPGVELERTPGLIDSIQEKLRPAYVAHGLMVGEFHARPPEKAGLWNQEFRPLHSPVPMLVIRHMVATDLAFLKDDRNLVAFYLRRFGSSIPAHLREELRKVARRHGLDLEEDLVTPHVHPRVSEALGVHRSAVTIHRHADLSRRIDSPRDFAEALGYPLDRVTKSLFVRTRDGEARYGIAVCSVNRRIDLSRIAETMGCRRVELATPEELSAQLGFSPGGVSPIGAGDIPVFMDQDLLDLPTVTVAAGEVAVEVEIEPQLLRRLTEATVLPLTARSEAVSL
jgi:Cys-tRNA(Pro) deacylase